MHQIWSIPLGAMTLQRQVVKIGMGRSDSFIIFCRNATRAIAFAKHYGHRQLAAHGMQGQTLGGKKTSSHATPWNVFHYPIAIVSGQKEKNLSSNTAVILQKGYHAH